jgi:hypothetical protein
MKPLDHDCHTSCDEERDGCDQSDKAAANKLSAGANIWGEELKKDVKQKSTVKLRPPSRDDALACIGASLRECRAWLRYGSRAQVGGVSLRLDEILVGLNYAINALETLTWSRGK